MPPGLNLSLRGQANENGRLGAAITVTNPVSKKLPRRHRDRPRPASRSARPPASAARPARRSTPPADPIRSPLGKKLAPMTDRTTRLTFKPLSLAAAVLVSSALGACNTVDRLSQVGATPTLSAIEGPDFAAGLPPGAPADAGRPAGLLRTELPVADRIARPSSRISAPPGSAIS